MHLLEWMPMQQKHVNRNKNESNKMQLLVFVYYVGVALDDGTFDVLSILSN